jgi:hypothetical protein
MTKSCRALVTREKLRCTRWRQLLGRDPQTGVEIDRWDCADNHEMTLQLEIAKACHEGAKATLDFRNAALIPEVRDRQVHQITEELKAIEAQS